MKYHQHSFDFNHPLTIIVEDGIDMATVYRCKACRRRGVQLTPAGQMWVDEGNNLYDLVPWLKGEDTPNSELEVLYANR